MDACVPHSYKIHIIPSTLSKNTQQGSWEGGQRFVLSQLLSGIPQLSTPSTPHTVWRRGEKKKKKIASLSLFGATFMFKAHTMSVSWVSCFYVTPWTIHFADFNLHAKWDWGFSSDADGDLISRRLNLRLQLESCRVQIFSQDFPV